ncbi:hypothetical protein MZA95_02905 [Haemophilus influenzae]
MQHISVPFYKLFSKGKKSMETLLNPKKEQKEPKIEQVPFHTLGKGSSFSGKIKGVDRK